VLVRRYRRFLADVELPDGELVVAHVPNTGSMRSTREPGSPVALSFHPEEHRKLHWTLELVRAGDAWVGVNTNRPNRIVEEAIGRGRIGPLRGYPIIRREVKYGTRRSRIDLLLEREGERCYVEVKNVTYREGRRALFPDAVTARGAKHLEELADMARAGHRAVVFFLVNRVDCASMGPAREIDPTYGELLDRVAAEGVELLAYRVKNDLRESRIDRKIRVVL
jgi:sugar fermentation stimulation protein A